VNWLITNANLITAIATVGLLVATAVLAFLTFLLARQTKISNQHNRELAEPEVFLKIWPSIQAPNCLNLVLTNTGGGNAYDVTVQFSGETSHFKHFPEDKKLHFTNIKSGDELTRFIADYAQLESKKYEMILEYKNKLGQVFSRSYFFDLELIGKSWMDIEKNWTYEQFKEVKSIRESLRHLASGFKRLKVDIFNEADREKAKVEHEKWAKEAREKRWTRILPRHAKTETSIFCHKSFRLR
jgi:hypothetical protein